jgi:hypothetical protein
VNSDAMNMGVQVTILRSCVQFFGIYMQRSLLGYVLVLFLIFGGISIPFSIVVIPFYNLANSVQGFHFLHILTNAVFWIFLEGVKKVLLMGVK